MGKGSVFFRYVDVGSPQLWMLITIPVHPSIHPSTRPCNGVEWRRPYSWNVGVHMFHDTSDRANSAPYNTFRTIWQT